MTVPDPPRPFVPAVEVLGEGEALYRVHDNTRGATDFNDSGLGSSRFAFFTAAGASEGAAVVPVLYAAATEAAAIAETLLHDVPVEGGVLIADAYRSAVLNRIVTTRPLRLARFHGLGLRQLRVTAAQLTDTPRSEYGRTVLWAQAVHATSDTAGPFDGITWMSRRCNSDRAYVLFGDRVLHSDLAIDETFGRIFADVDGTAWLSDLCAPLGVDVLHS